MNEKGVNEKVRRKSDGRIIEMVGKENDLILVKTTIWVDANAYEFNDKETLKKETATLYKCPFCNGNAEFIADKSGFLNIRHLPEAGICCPARFEQVCDTFEMGRKWWNQRIGKYEEYPFSESSASSESSESDEPTDTTR